MILSFSLIESFVMIMPSENDISFILIGNSSSSSFLYNDTVVSPSLIYNGKLDLNPNMYHTYSDLTYTPSEIKPSKNLFNKVIYFFLKPTVLYEVKCDNDSLIFNLEDDSEMGDILEENQECLYHKIDDAQPNSDMDIQIGSVYIRQNTSLHSTVIVDSRTRGGGVLESMRDSLRHELEPESDYYLDIGYYDGEPYQENGVIIVRLDNSLLKDFGGRFTQGDIEAKVKRWLGLGVYPIIEYFDVCLVFRYWNNVYRRTDIFDSFLLEVWVMNPWQKNNVYFNFRKLKSYKIQNVIGEQYGDFSSPSWRAGFDSTCILINSWVEPSENTASFSPSDILYLFKPSFLCSFLI